MHQIIERGEGIPLLLLKLKIMALDKAKEKKEKEVDLINYLTEYREVLD